MSSNSSEETFLTIHIEELTLSAIMGILDFERTTPQKLIIDLTIDYHYSHGDFINYAEVITLLEHKIIENKYQLLEDALRDLREILLQTYPQIREFYLKITKPTIIANAEVALSIRVKN